MGRVDGADRRPRVRTIAVLARESGVGISTIRYYEDEGLLIRPPRPPRGWRVYPDEAVAAVTYIRLAQEIGFTITEIKQLARRLRSGGNFCRDFRAALDHKLRETRAEIQRLDAVEEKLARTLSSCLAKAGRGECPITRQFGSRPRP